MQEEVLRLARLQQAGQRAGQVPPEDAVALQRIGAAVVQNLLKEPVVQDLQKPLRKMKEARVVAVKAEIENKSRELDTDNKVSVVKKDDQLNYISSSAPAAIDKDSKPLKSSKKTKHVNPLTKSLPRVKTSKAKAGVKILPISTATASTDSTSDVDFPDDPDYPQFRSVAAPADPDNDPDYPDDPKFRSSAEEAQTDERVKRTVEELNDNKFRKRQEETPDSLENGDFYLRRTNEGAEGFRKTSSDDDGRND